MHRRTGIGTREAAHGGLDTRREEGIGDVAAQERPDGDRAFVAVYRLECDGYLRDCRPEPGHDPEQAPGRADRGRDAVGETPNPTGAVSARMGETTTALSKREGWRSEGYAARVHYEGATEQYSVEYYEPTGRVVYWHVRSDGEAVPVARDAVPTPLRERIRSDLSAAGVDPDLERATL